MLRQKGIQKVTPFPLSFRGKALYWVSFVTDVWFVDFGDVEVTSNGEKIKFPYRYTASDLTKTLQNS